MMRKQADIKDRVYETVSAYESVIELKPDYHQAMLYMVEILSVPVEFGGDQAMAEGRAAELEKMDGICGAKGRELLLSEEVNRVKYWQEKLTDHPGHPEVLEQLGKACLYAQDPENGMKYLEQSLEADPSKTTLYLDMARYYFMSSRMDPEKSDAYLPRAETAVRQFLETEPIIPLKAYAYNMLSWIKRGLEQNEEAERMRAQAQSLDPNVSQASAIPPQLLFDEPDHISTYHSYFSRPF
jgi:tetratricopeptide (TPR) repeat protein